MGIVQCLRLFATVSGTVSYSKAGTMRDVGIHVS
jgi:hypothetical protein